MTQFTGNILALDLATVTGWAFGRPGQKPKFGSVRFGKVGASRALCYRTFRNWLDVTWNVAQPDLAVFESAAMSTMHTGKTTADVLKKLIGFTEHFEEWCHERIELREANISQVRAHFIGTTHLKRDQAKAATIDKCKAFGWDVTNDNEADACALWTYQVSCLRPDLAAKMTPLFYGKTGRIINEW